MVEPNLWRCGQRDQLAAEVERLRVDNQRLRARVDELAGRPVEIGDGVMFHFPEPAQGVRCGLECVDAAADQRGCDGLLCS